MNDFILSWTEDGQANTVYLRVSDAAATALAEALQANAAFDEVTLTRQETVHHAMTLRKKTS